MWLGNRLDSTSIFTTGALEDGSAAPACQPPVIGVRAGARRVGLQIFQTGLYAPSLICLEQVGLSRKRGNRGASCPLQEIALGIPPSQFGRGCKEQIKDPVPVPREELPLGWPLDCRSALNRRTWQQVSRPHSAIAPFLPVSVLCFCQIGACCTYDRNSLLWEHRKQRYGATGASHQGPKLFCHFGPPNDITRAPGAVFRSYASGSRVDTAG
jgi:hypothetical protein